MIVKTIVLILLVITCDFLSHACGDDNDCGADLDLSLYYMFNFSGNDIILEWQPNSQTDCPLLYHLIVLDSELGVIQNEYLEGKSAKLRGVSPCIATQIDLRAINEAFPTVEGPPVLMTIDFSRKPQIAPRLESLDIQATSINMTWALEGNTNRCPLIQFYVAGGSYFNVTVPLQDVSDRDTVSVEVTSLRPNSMYYFQVYVENNAGLSPATPLAVQTLELTDEKYPQ